MTTIGRFFESVGKRMGNNLVEGSLLEFHVRGGILSAINGKHPEAEIGWQTKIEDKRTWIEIYYQAAQLLKEAVRKNHQGGLTDIAAAANRVSAAISLELKESMKLDAGLIPIRFPN